MDSRFRERRDKLRRRVLRAGADALLVTEPTNVTYLTGFTGDDSYLLISKTAEIAISDGRYLTQLEEECPGLDGNPPHGRHHGGCGGSGDRVEQNREIRVSRPTR